MLRACEHTFCCFRMKMHFAYFAIILVVFLFIILAASMNMGCGSMFTENCFMIKNISLLRGAVAVSLIFYIFASAFSLIFILKKFNWALHAEIVVLVAGTICLLSAACIFFAESNVYSQIFTLIATALSFELVFFSIIGLF